MPVPGGRIVLRSTLQATHLSLKNQTLRRLIVPAEAETYPESPRRCSVITFIFKE
jgi:hypothetical protein